jgi:hypothetical protein
MGEEMGEEMGTVGYSEVGEMAGLLLTRDRGHEMAEQPFVHPSSHCEVFSI